MIKNHTVIVFAVLVLSISPALRGQSVDFKWVKQFGGTNYDCGNSISVDVSNNVYVTGHFQGTIDFNPGVGTFNMTALGNQDVFVLKLDSAGQFIWAKQFGASNGFHDGLSVAVDSSGNVYTTGYIGGTADFDPGVGTFYLSSANDFHDNFIYYDVFVSKLDSAGNFVWANRFGGFLHDYGRSISVDKFGYLYIAGEFMDVNVDFDPGIGTHTISAQSVDMFVSKLDTSGNFKWVRQIGGKGADGGTAIIADQNGNVYSTGLFQDTCDFDPGIGISNLIATSYYDAFISKLDSAGNFIWAKKVGGIGSSTTNSGKAIVTDVAGDIYIAGYFYGSGDFDPNPGAFILTSVSGMDIFILKLSSSGSFIWAKQMGGNFNEMAESIALDILGNVYITGFFQDTCDFDPSLSTFNLSSNGAWDIFVSKLNSLGNFMWAKKMGGTQIEEGTSIAVNKHGSIYTTGRFIGTADFDPDIGIFNLTSNGVGDIFIHCLSSDNFVGIQEYRIGSSLPPIYPNPSDGNFYIKITLKGNESCTYQIFDISGRLLESGAKENPENNITFNMAGKYKGGMYLLKLSLDNEQHVYKFIIE